VKRVVVGILLFTSGSIFPGDFGSSFAGSLGGSFVGSSLANVTTRPRVTYKSSGDAARAAIEIANQASIAVSQLNARVSRLESEIARMGAIDSKINFMERDIQRLKQDNDKIYSKMIALEDENRRLSSRLKNGTQNKVDKKSWWSFS
jgi:outer membrane murein-binding lipoprotein Lpp